MTRNYITKSSPEIRELRAALKVLFEHNPGSEAYYNDTLESDEHEDTSSSCYSPNLTKSSGSRSSLEIRQPLWDEVDHIYRCLDCAFEVYYAYCQNCHAFYDMSDPASEDDDNTFRVIATDDTSMRSSRQMTPRGTTPLLQVDPDVEFSELLARGATAEMCKRFSLEFIPAAGIIAWLDEELERRRRLHIHDGVLGGGDTGGVNLG